MKATKAILLAALVFISAYRMGMLHDKVWHRSAQMGVAEGVPHKMDELGKMYDGRTNGWIELDAGEAGKPCKTSPQILAEPSNYICVRGYVVSLKDQPK